MNRCLNTLLVAVSALALMGAAAEPGVRITIDRTTGTADVRAIDAPLRDLIKLSSLRSGTFVEGSIPEQRVSIRLTNVPVNQLVGRIAHEAGLLLVATDGVWRLIDPDEARVSLDVVDAELDQIIGSLARQCGIRNVMIDPGVQGQGTFIFDSVPCSNAFPVVFRTLGIRGYLHPNSVLVVRRGE